MPLQLNHVLIAGGWVIWSVLIYFAFCGGFRHASLSSILLDLLYVTFMYGSYEQSIPGNWKKVMHPKYYLVVYLYLEKLGVVSEAIDKLKLI